MAEDRQQESQRVGGRYLLMIEDDGCSIEVPGPYPDDVQRVEAAKLLLRAPNPGENHRDVYRLDIDDRGRPAVSTLMDQDGFLLADSIAAEKELE